MVHWSPDVYGLRELQSEKLGQKSLVFLWSLVFLLVQGGLLSDNGGKGFGWIKDLTH